jgi:hypothetical protein
MQVDSIDRLGGGVQKQPDLPFPGSQCLLRLLPLDEQPHLDTDGGHHPQYLLIGLLDAFAKELHDAEDFPALQDRKAHGCVQTRLSRNLVPGQVHVLHHVLHPDRFPSDPYPARQPFALREGILPADRQEPVQVG